MACNWTKVIDPWEGYLYHHIDCGEDWSLTVDSDFADQRINFCHSCGKPVREVIPLEDDDDQT